MTSRCLRSTALCLLIMARATAASAQEPAVDLARIDAITRPGDTLVVTDSGGRVTRWTLDDVTSGSLLTLTGVPPTDVARLAIERRDSPWNGAAIGLAIAAAPWLIACAAHDWCYYNEYGAENMLRTTALTMAAIGAGIGALVDRSVQQRIIVYQAPRRRTATIRAWPVLSPAHVTIRIRATF